MPRRYQGRHRNLTYKLVRRGLVSLRGVIYAHPGRRGSRPLWVKNHCVDPGVTRVPANRVDR